MTDRFKTRPVCVCCGKAYGERDTRYVELRWADGEPVPAPELKEGERVVKAWALRHLGDSKRIQRYDIWDGESWWTRYAPFCTLRCALAYARAAHDYLTKREARRAS